MPRSREASGHSMQELQLSQAEAQLLLSTEPSRARPAVVASSLKPRAALPVARLPMARTMSTLLAVLALGVAALAQQSIPAGQDGTLDQCQVRHASPPPWALQAGPRAGAGPCRGWPGPVGGPAARALALAQPALTPLGHAAFKLWSVLPRPIPLQALPGARPACAGPLLTAWPLHR